MSSMRCPSEVVAADDLALIVVLILDGLRHNLKELRLCERFVGARLVRNDVAAYAATFGDETEAGGRSDGCQVFVEGSPDLVVRVSAKRSWHS